MKNKKILDVPEKPIIVTPRVNPIIVRLLCLRERQQQKMAIEHRENPSAKMYSTRNYDMFIPNPANRGLTVKHVMEIVEDIKKGFDYMANNPITVDENMVIIAGHHRLAAARICNVDVYYTIRVGGTIRDAIRQDKRTEKWKLTDQIGTEIAEHHQEYEKLDKLHRQYPWLGISILIRLSSTAGFIKDDFYEGRYKADRITFARRVCEMALDFKPIIDFWMTSHFINTMMQLAADGRYDHMRMLRKVGYQQGKLRRQASVKQYLEMFNDIYNNREQERNQVFFRAQKRLPNYDRTEVDTE